MRSCRRFASRYLRKLTSSAVFFAILVAPLFLSAQITASGVFNNANSPVVASGAITSNIVNTTVNLFSQPYITQITAFSVSVAGGNLTGCSVSPQVRLIDSFGSGDNVVGTVTLTNGQSSWSLGSGLPYTIDEVNDQIQGVVFAAGVGCGANVVPMTLSVTYLGGATIPIATMPSVGAAIMLSASTATSLTCSTTYPLIQFNDTRGGVATSLGTIQLTSGTFWQGIPSFIPLQSGDVISATLANPGNGCTGEFPLKAKFTYNVAAGLCAANPSACINLTGELAAANGLASSNYTATFSLNQIGFLGGTPPENPGGSGICESLGVSPGDICYYNGTTWTILSGNESTELFLSETTGVPSWQPSGNGGCPAGSNNDVQINENGSCAVDAGIGTIDPVAHKSSENIVNANQQVAVSDATNSGIICQGHSNGTSIDAAICSRPSDTFSNFAGGYGMFYPDNAPASAGDVVTVTSLTTVPVTTSYGTIQFYPTHFAPAGAGNCLGLAALDTDCAGPLPPTDPRSAIVQDKMCTIGDTPTCTGGGITVSCTTSTAGPSFAHCTYSIDQPITAGDTGYVEFEAICGLGCSGNTNSMSDTAGNTWTQMENGDGSGASIPAASFWSHMVSGADTISVNLDNGGGGFQFRGFFHFVELRGTVAPDAFGFNGSSVSGAPSIPTVTTTNATDTILSSLFQFGGPCTFAPGTGFGLINQLTGTVFTSNHISDGAESQNVASPGAYTPTITSTCGASLGGAFTTAFTQSVYGGPGIPAFRLTKYIDLVAGMDFPTQVGNGGSCLASSGEDYQPLVWASCGGSIQFKNNGTNFGSPMTGAGSLNFVNATVSGTAPNFTVTVSGAGDTITSPNGTLTVGGTSSNTTLDVAGATGKMLAGSTPALTFTPALGVDGTSAGTLQLANGSSSAHTIFGSAATTSNTILGPPTVIPNTHFVTCTTSGTTCTLTDGGAVPTGGGSPVYKLESTGYALLLTDFSTPTAGCGHIQVHGAVTITVPSSATPVPAGQCVLIYPDNFASTVTIASNGQSVNNNTPLYYSMSAELVSDGTNFWMVGSIYPINDGGDNDLFYGYSIAGQGAGYNTMFCSDCGNASMGIQNTLMGRSVGKNFTGSQSVFIGQGAGNDTTAGGDNIAIGVSAQSSTTGSYNTAIGANVDTVGHNTSGSNNIFIGGDSSGSVGSPSGSTSNYVNIGNLLIGDRSKGIAIWKGSATTIGANACGSTSQGTLTSGSNDIAGEVTVGTATVTSCAISFANTHNSAPFCVITPRANITVYLSALSTTGFTISSSSNMDSDKIEYHCFAGSTSNNPTP